MHNVHYAYVFAQRHLVAAVDAEDEAGGGHEHIVHWQLLEVALHEANVLKHCRAARAIGGATVRGGA